MGIDCALFENKGCIFVSGKFPPADIDEYTTSAVRNIDVGAMIFESWMTFIA